MPWRAETRTKKVLDVVVIVVVVVVDGGVDADRHDPVDYYYQSRRHCRAWNETGHDIVDTKYRVEVVVVVVVLSLSRPWPYHLRKRK